MKTHAPKDQRNASSSSSSSTSNQTAAPSNAQQLEALKSSPTNAEPGGLLGYLLGADSGAGMSDAGGAPTDNGRTERPSIDNDNNRTLGQAARFVSQHVFIGMEMLGPVIAEAAKRKASGSTQDSKRYEWAKEMGLYTDWAHEAGKPGQAPAPLDDSDNWETYHGTDEEVLTAPDEFGDRNAVRVSPTAKQDAGVTVANAITALKLERLELQARLENGNGTPGTSARLATLGDLQKKLEAGEDVDDTVRKAVQAGVRFRTGTTDTTTTDLASDVKSLGSGGRTIVTGSKTETKRGDTTETRTFSSTIHTGVNWADGTYGKSVTVDNNDVTETIDPVTGRKTSDSRIDNHKTFAGLSLTDGAKLSSETEEGTRNTATGERNLSKKNASATLKDGLSAGESTDVRDENGRVTQTHTSATLNLDGATAKTGGAKGVERDHWSRKGSVDVDGGIKVTLEPIKDKTGKVTGYKMVTSITAGAGLGFNGNASTHKADDHPDARDNRGPKASVTAGASVKGSVAYTHKRTLSKADAAKYMADTKKKGLKGAASNWVPEQLLKAGDWVTQDGKLDAMATALGSGSGARSMKTGDSISLVLQGSASGTLGVSGKSGGGSVSHEESLTRTLSVSRKKSSGPNPRDIVEVTIAFEDAGTTSGAFNASQGLASGEAKLSRKRGTGDSLTFELDPTSADFDRQYATITTTTQRSKLQRLRDAYDKQLTSDVASTLEENKQSAGIKALKAAFDVGEQDSFSSKVDSKKGTSEFTGANGANASLSAPGIKIGSDHKESGTAKVSKNNEISVDTSSTQTDTSIGLGKLPTSASDLYKRMLALDKELQQTTTALSTFKLGNSEVSGLISLAHSDSSWQRHAANYAGTPWKQWLALQTKLVRPQYTKGQPTEVTDKEKAVFRARAIARFMQKAEGAGQEILYAAVRNTGDGHNAGTGGAAAEFPPGLKLTQAEYEAILADADALTLSLASEADVSKRIALADAHQQREQTARSALVACTSFKAPAARAEMLASLDAAGSKRRLAYQKAMLGESSEAAPADPSGAFLEQEQRSRLRNTLTTLRALKADETRLFKSIEDELNSFFTIDSNKIGAWFGAIDASWPRWIREVQKARSLHQAVGSKKWLVSEGPETTRNLSYEPNLERYEALSARWSGWENADKKAARKAKLEGY